MHEFSCGFNENILMRIYCFYVFSLDTYHGMEEVLYNSKDNSTIFLMRMQGHAGSKISLLQNSGFWATLCKTVRPMLSVRCLSCQSDCLSVCTVPRFKQPHRHFAKRATYSASAVKSNFGNFGDINPFVPWVRPCLFLTF